MPSDAVALLVIRARLEVDSLRPLRAEIRLTTDVSRGIESTVNLSDPESVTAAVGAWLQGVLDG